MVIPGPLTLLADHEAAVTIQKPTITLTKWKSRVETLRPTLTFTRKKNPVVFKVNAPIKFNYAGMNARPVPTHEVAGFRKVVETVPPRNPEQTRVEDVNVYEAHLGAQEADPVLSAE
jgi:hypothetical protein